MRAAVLSARGGVPAAAEFREPSAAEGQRVVSVRAAGLNPVDLRAAAGAVESPPALPSVVGHEGVGTVEEDGRRCYFERTVAPFGSIAERALVARGDLVPLPLDVDDDTAIALGIAGMAAWLALTHHARLERGERVLVLGSGGAVGRIAVQLARHMGAVYVAAVTRHPTGEGLALGADVEIPLGDGLGFVDQAPGAAEGGYDVVIDMLWGQPAVTSLSSLRAHGRLVQVGSSASEVAEIPAGALRRRQLSLVGHANPRHEPERRRAAFLELLALAAAGKLQTESQRLPLAEIASAWERQRQGPGLKLVLDPRPRPATPRPAARAEDPPTNGT